MSQKGKPNTADITLSKFYHYRIFQEICNKVKSLLSCISPFFAAFKDSGINDLESRSEVSILVPIESAYTYSY